MFAQTSRYAHSATAIHTTRDGQQHPYVLLRLLPAPGPLRQTYDVREGDRLDLLASRFFADPEQFWRLCDANRTLRPEDLELAGQSIRIPLVSG